MRAARCSRSSLVLSFSSIASPRCERTAGGGRAAGVALPSAAAPPTLGRSSSGRQEAERGCHRRPPAVRGTAGADAGDKLAAAGLLQRGVRRVAGARGPGGCRTGGVCGYHNERAGALPPPMHLRNAAQPAWQPASASRASGPSRAVTAAGGGPLVVGATHLRSVQAAAGGGWSPKCHNGKPPQQPFPNLDGSLRSA